MSTAFRVLLFILYLPVAVVLSLLSEVGIEPDPFPKRRTFVRGKESCAALPLADALREAGNEAWLAWSKAHLVLLTADETSPRVLWHGSGDQNPKVEINKKCLQWPDGSIIGFNLSTYETNQVHNGTA